MNCAINLLINFSANKIVSFCHSCSHPPPLIDLFLQAVTVGITGLVAVIRHA